MQWAFGRNFPTQFESQYNCSSTAMAGRDVDEGDKIFLPPSALDRLARMNVEYPMLFEIKNDFIGKVSHCGVLEFSAEEGWCYMPFWMMQNLLIEEGALITVKNVSLAKASFVKFRAQSVDFLEVSNPRAVLEFSLRKFTCLTVGDTICIPYASKKFYFDVRDVQPNGKASIIETDCNVDFEEPLGYKDSKYAQYEKKREQEIKEKSDKSFQSESIRTLQKAKIETEEEIAIAAKSFKAFSGSAKRIDGKINNNSNVVVGGNESKTEETKTSSSSSSSSNNNNNNQAPVYQSKIGDKYSKKKVAVSAFTGQAHKLNP